MVGLYIDNDVFVLVLDKDSYIHNYKSPKVGAYDMNYYCKERKPLANKELTKW